MVIATDKSIVISGPKHGSSESIEIFNDYLNELGYSSSNYTLDFRKTRIKVVNSMLKNIYSTNPEFSFNDIKNLNVFYEYLDHFKFSDPIYDLFTSLTSKNQKPIFILLRRPIQSYKSALLQDLSLSLFNNPSKLLRKYSFESKMDFSNEGVVFKSLLSFLSEEEVLEVFKYCLKEYYTELSSGSHLLSMYIKDILLFLLLVKSYTPIGLENINLIDIDSYNPIHREYFTQMKVMRDVIPSEYLSSNKSILSVLDTYINSNLDSLPLYRARVQQEENDYSMILRLFFNNFNHGIF